MGKNDRAGCHNLYFSLQFAIISQIGTGFARWARFFGKWYENGHVKSDADGSADETRAADDSVYGDFTASYIRTP